MKIKVSKRFRESCLSLLALLPIIYTPYSHAVAYVVNTYSSSIASLMNSLFYFIGIILFIGAFTLLIKRIDMTIIMVFMWFICQYGLQIFLHSQYTTYYTDMLSTTFNCLIWFIFAYCARDEIETRKMQSIAAYIILVCGIIFVFGGGIIRLRADVGKSYNQLLSYCFAFAPAFFAIKAIEESKLKDFALAIVSLVIALSLGTRGALISVLVCFVLACIEKNRCSNGKSINYKHLAYMVLVVLFIGFVYIFYQQILLFISNKMSAFGGTNRVITSILTGTFDESSSRGDIRNRAFELLNDKWILGYGLSSERLFLGTNSIAYVHNYLLELLLQYGYVLGLPIIIVWCFYFYKSIGYARKIRSFDNYLAYISVGLVPLLFSSSYLQWTPYFILLGNMCRLLKEKRKELVYKDER